jgi:NAD(P)-dependent dehydrogenase (short-subunit alcohol dehydrogenase family)
MCNHCPCGQVSPRLWLQASRVRPPPAGRSTHAVITSGCDRLGNVHQPPVRPATIITGGTRGIGVATAVRLARAGHDLVLGYRNDDGAAQQAAAAVQDAGARCVLARADVTREDDVEQLFAVAADQLGPVTGLVNNAGATIHIGDLADTPVQVIRDVIDINLLGVILCARQASKVMSVSRGGLGGAIVNISSAAATLGSAHEYVHYAAAKAAVEGFTVGLAKELAAEQIRVNAVAPGIVRTAIHATAGDPGRPDRVAKNIPLGRAGESDEIAPAIAWLLGPEAGYVTGAVLRVAGGL